MFNSHFVAITISSSSARNDGDSTFVVAQTTHPANDFRLDKNDEVVVVWNEKFPEILEKSDLSELHREIGAQLALTVVSI